MSKKIIQARGTKRSVPTGLAKCKDWTWSVVSGRLPVERPEGFMSWQSKLSFSFSRCVDKNFSRIRKDRPNVKFDAKKRKLVQ